MNKIIEELITKSCEMINSTEFKNDNRRSDKDFKRERKMSFKNIVYFCINFIKKSLQIELDDFMELIDGELEKPITKQAFSKARQHISPKAFEDLFLMTSETLLNSADSKRYKGYHVYAIHGTELELSRSKELAQYYPPARNNVTAPRARVSIMCNVLSGAIIHADFQSLKVDERTLALHHLNYFKSLSSANNCKGLFIFDREYPSKNLIEYFENNNLKYLMRLQKSFNAEIESTHKNDFYVKFVNGKAELNVRVIKLILSTGEEEVLITNLGRKAFGKSEFQQLYFLRWGVETKYNTLKNKLQLEDFSGKTVVSVLQDFYATLYLSNIASAVKVETDEIIKTLDLEKI